jgi:preprotein translocase subunit SecG
VTLIVVIHAFVCLFLVVVILLQPGKGDAGVGFGSSSQSIFGSKGAGNFLTKLTSLCAVAYLLLSFVLTRSRIQESVSVVSDDEPAQTEPAKATPPPAEAPKAEPAKPDAKK